METQRGKLELNVEGRKGFGHIQWRNHVNEGIELWGHRGAGRDGHSSLVGVAMTCV